MSEFATIVKEVAEITREAPSLATRKSPSEAVEWVGDPSPTSLLRLCAVVDRPPDASYTGLLYQVAWSCPARLDSLFRRAAELCGETLKEYARTPGYVTYTWGTRDYRP